jgi:hypothetical protein
MILFMTHGLIIHQHLLYQSVLDYEMPCDLISASRQCKKSLMATPAFSQCPHQQQVLKTFAGLGRFHRC